MPPCAGWGREMCFGRRSSTGSLSRGGRERGQGGVEVKAIKGGRVPGTEALKMALGENPKQVYGEGKKQAPSTRMGNALVCERPADLVSGHSGPCTC